MKRRLGVALLFLFASGLLASALAQTTGPADVEIERFILPGTNTTGWRVHGARTELNLTLSQGDLNALGGYKMQVGFSHGGRVVTNSSNVSVPAAGTIGDALATSGVLYQRAAYAGSILAVAIASSQALTAGYAHAEATIYKPTGNEFVRMGLTTLIGFTETTGRDRANTTTQAKDVDRFTSADGLGCQITTTSDVAPTTIELLCTLVVEM